ncbi:hypothetical protein Hanom_Chr04g00284761 [Helianthus anomalus]
MHRNKHTDGTAFFDCYLKPTFKLSSFKIWMMKKNLWELKEQALLEMLQALREAELQTNAKSQESLEL